jgi:SAM-dependent methyltransferase
MFLGGTKSARVLTVDAERHPEIARILDAFERAQGIPVLVHAPLALPGEPPVARIEDARRVFLSSEVDALQLDSGLEEKASRRAQIEARRALSSGDTTRSNAESDSGIDALWACPACGGALLRAKANAHCRSCNRTFAQEEGIWRLFHPHEPHEGDVTELVKGFYEEHPFPNYDVNESVGTLMEKSRRGVYARQLFEQIPFDARVLEVGCGTGQLSNFLGIGCRTVVGTDLCLNSLRLGERFRNGQGLARVRFAQMNLFRPAFAPASFDVVLCNGVLHHTADPRGGFESIAKLVKPGGLIVIGLYNTYGRLLLDARRVVFRLTGGRFKWIDSYLRTTPMSKEKIDAWFHDQYRHPHESKHTMGEVLEWFDAAGFEFVHGVPPTSPWTDYTEDAALFEREEAGNAVERAIAQTQMIATGSREGGFFIMIGRKVG